MTRGLKAGPSYRGNPGGIPVSTGGSSPRASEPFESGSPPVRAAYYAPIGCGCLLGGGHPHP